MTEGILCLLPGVAILVVAGVLPSDIAFLKWAGRVGDTAVAALFWLFTEAHCQTVRPTFRAEFSPMRTALETVRGIARDVDGRLQASKISKKLDGRPVELHGFPTGPLAGGDDVIVAGKQRSGVLMAAPIATSAALEPRPQPLSAPSLSRLCFWWASLGSVWGLVEPGRERA